MNNVLRLAENGCVNPFSTVFSNATGRYIPAHDKGAEKSSVFPGGQRQASILINLHRISFRYLCSNSKFANKNTTHATFERDYVVTVSSKLRNIGDKWAQRKAMLTNGNLPTSFTDKKLYQRNQSLYDEFVKGFKFLKKFEDAGEGDTFDIEDLPNLPENSLLSKIKILTKAKNIVHVNKLLNNSL